MVEDYKKYYYGRTDMTMLNDEKVYGSLGINLKKITTIVEGVGSLMLPNSLEAPVERVELIGNSVQPTTTGKNLANPSEFVIGTLAGGTGNIINLKQYITTGYIPVIPGKRYSTSCGNKFLAHAITAYDKEKTKINYPMNMSSEMPEGAAYIRLSYRKIDMTNVTESDMEELKKVCIVNEGSTVLPYEPYTGLKPSPSPEYPQEIMYAGKWNEEKQKYEISVTMNNSGYLQKGSYHKRIRPLRLEKGKTYRIYVSNKSEIVNAFILNEEKTFKDGGTLYNYGYYTKKLTVPNKTGVISGECMLQQMLNLGYVFTVTADGLFLYQGVNSPSFDTDSAYITYDVIKTVNGDEPYTEQTLTITSDRPITKWDKLVEQGGEYGWLYGGKIIDSYNSEPIDTEYMSSAGQLSIGATVLYRLKESEFIPLSESEQTQLRNLHSYNGTTYITVDSGEVPCGIKVEYVVGA